MRSSSLLDRPGQEGRICAIKKYRAATLVAQTGWLFKFENNSLIVMH